MGTSAHKKIMKLIIDTNLDVDQSYLDHTHKQITHSGCKLWMPTLDASAPVRNGKNAEPVCPKPAIQPIDPVKSRGGSTRPAWFMTIG